MPTGGSPDEDRLSLRRRRVLAASGLGIAAVAGCANGDDDDSEEPDLGDDNDDTDDASEDEDDQEDEDDETDDTDEEDEEEEADEEEGEEEGSPDFEIAGIDHPDEVEVDEEHTFTIDVENVGDGVGTFEEVVEFSIAGDDEWDNAGVVTLEDIGPDETASWESGSISFSEPSTVQYRIGETQWEYDVTITEPDAQSFSGSGQSVEQGIEIEGGLVVIEGSHDGESNFQVSLEDDSDFGENFINEIGAFDGAQANLVDEGEYILDVTADGNWDVTIRQPRSGQGDSLPVSFADTGPRVVGPVRFTGTGVAVGEHDGESNFQVQIYPMTGSFGETVFNEIDEFEGETTYSFDEIGWVDVNADGSWSVEFE